MSAGESDPVPEGVPPKGNASAPAEDVPGFAPDEPTDERKLGDWRSRYWEKSARRAIQIEAAFVWLCLSGTIAGILFAAIISTMPDQIVPSQTWESLSPFVLSYLGGLLGGTLFSMKWLYHTVAKGLWNRDRRLWRIFTPFLSGGASLTVILLCASGAIPLFGPELVRTNVGALGLSVVFGYFSDRAFSSLERVAEDNLGLARKRKATGQQNAKEK
ncbi:hypothetical protein QCD70_06720 [Agreia sp. PsM10]|uniref:hypothetical protein n=1 Tax=Agreia sp. PsM10 TaxID=3030533 RepID=UPI00263BD753|nr:hypothetical protein [Agreia sp. PsM10]MDN4639929.1 hypothetical protein [Agreia sp. PsM10]